MRVDDLLLALSHARKLGPALDGAEKVLGFLKQADAELARLKSEQEKVQREISTAHMQLAQVHQGIKEADAECAALVARAARVREALAQLTQ